jgi:hypothetical protein
MSPRSLTSCCLFFLSAFVVFAARTVTQDVTFHKDVEPILQRRCQSCHRPGQIAPMSLMTYKEVRPWAKSIRVQLLTGKMPPWHVNPSYGKFRNDLSLARGEKETLVSWIDHGAPEGNPSDAPLPRAFTEGWSIPEPDAVFEMPKPFHIPAKGVLDYQYIPVPTNFTEDKWVQMAEVRPSDPAVVHHSIVMVAQGGDMSDQQYLAGYAPGMSPQIWEPGQARLIKAGSILIFQMHYQANGKATEDQTRLGLVFSKQPVKERIMAMEVLGLDIAIPPGDPNYRADASLTMRKTVRLVAMRAHMHLRGKSFQFRAVYPDGKSEILLDIPHYDFNWQPYYYLATPKVLPQGTRIECTAYYDNSANNRFNPDPTKLIRWGPQSWDEMMIGWLDVAVEQDPAEPSLRGALQHP